MENFGAKMKAKANNAVSSPPSDASHQPDSERRNDWEIQKASVNEFKDEKLNNVLNYQEVPFACHEWDNIPTIVPKMLIYIEKYVKGFSEIFKELLSKIDTVSLQDQMLEITNRMIVEAKETRQSDLVEK